MFDRKKQTEKTQEISRNQIPYHDDAGSQYDAISLPSDISSNREEYFPWRLFQTTFRPVVEPPELSATQTKSGNIWGPRASAGHHE